jgi:SAM-dependent methyltransferase
MEFYEDGVSAARAAHEPLPLRAHFHTWTPRSIADVWSIWANTSVLRGQFYPPHYYEAMLDDAAAHIGRPDVVVDIGCGTGTVLSILRRHGIGRQLIGVDLSEESLRPLREAHAGDASMAFTVGSISATGLDAASCDLVVCTETLEHLFPADFNGGLDEIARILRPGGRLLATVPLEERPNFVACPECHSIFTPYQHMLFNFTIDGLAHALAQRGLAIAHVIHPIDTGVPRQAWKRVLKDRVMRRLFPGLTRRLFRVAGVSGFVAVRRPAHRGEGAPAGS